MLSMELRDRKEILEPIPVPQRTKQNPGMCESTPEAVQRLR